jgi:hypothetical protein
VFIIFCHCDRESNEEGLFGPVVSVYDHLATLFQDHGEAQHLGEAHGVGQRASSHSRQEAGRGVWRQDMPVRHAASPTS